MREVETILEGTSAFITEIRHTAIYEEYRCAAEELAKYPELKELTDTFRKERNLAYEALEGPTCFTQLADLEKTEAWLMTCPQIERFLTAELYLCRALQKAQGLQGSGDV